MYHELLDSGNDLVKWQKTLSFLPYELQDVYFYPGYVGMHKNIEGTKALLFTYIDNGNCWLYPFLLQPIESNGFSHNQGVWFDIESAYGYGGPLSNTENHRFIKNANEQFNEWCLENKVVAEFIRYHPIIKNEKWSSKDHKINEQRQTIAIKCPAHHENIHYSNPKVRNMLRRITKAGVDVRQLDIEKYYEKFIDIYIQNMKRINADKYYFFSNNYFFNLKKFSQKHGVLVGAMQKNKLIGASLFLYGKTYMHYHLSATANQSKVPGVANALIDYGAYKAKSNYMHLLHLGGGNTNSSENSLYKFKSSMGNEKYTYSVGERIYNTDVYNHLKSSWETEFPLLKEKFGCRFLCYRYVPSKFTCSK